MKSITAATLSLATALLIAAPAYAQTPAPPAEQKPAAADIKAVKVHGTIAAVDKDAKTITLKGPKGRTVTLDVADPQKLDVVKVGDPVVATYYEAVALEVKKSDAATPGVT